MFSITKGYSYVIYCIALLGARNMEWLVPWISHCGDRCLNVSRSSAV